MLPSFVIQRPIVVMTQIAVPEKNVRGAKNPEPQKHNKRMVHVSTKKILDK